MNQEINDKFAVLFDMDGVLVDSVPYHNFAWKEFRRKYNFSITDDDWEKNGVGRTNKDVLNYLFNKELSEDEILKYSEEKETIYREMYKEHIKPIEGLFNFLQILKSDNVEIAIASSAPKANIDFILDAIGAREYFEVIVDERFVSKGKPDPQVYLKAADLLKVKPNKCIVFEDALSGVRSGKSAGMKVAGVMTTQNREELLEAGADMVLDNFDGLTSEKLYKMFSSEEIGNDTTY